MNALRISELKFNTTTNTLIASRSQTEPARIINERTNSVKITLQDDNGKLLVFFPVRVDFKNDLLISTYRPTLQTLINYPESNGLKLDVWSDL